MSEEKGKLLELSVPELRKMLMICAKELISQLYHDAVDPELLTLLTKGNTALAPEAKEDAKEQIPG